MDPRRDQEQSGLFQTNQPIRTDIEAIRLEAAQTRDAAIGDLLRRGLRALGQAFAVVGAALATWPQRRATYDNLRRLTDRELADIGMTRGDIFRVFEPDFRLPSRPANTNSVPGSSRTQAA